MNSQSQTRGLKSRAVKAGLAIIIFLTISFIALPVASLFLKSPLDTVMQSLNNPMVADALKLSLSTAAITTITVVFGKLGIRMLGFSILERRLPTPLSTCR